MIGIIDYGMGNLRSVQKALERLGIEAEITNDSTKLSDFGGVILPGVGAFRDAITELERQDFISPLRDVIDSGTPLLGICLGMQLLLDRSFEDGEHEGLGIIPGEVIRFQSEPGLKIPHMGWNSLEFESSHPLLSEIRPGDFVYFVHSYHVRPESDKVVTAWTQHGEQTFASVINSGNVFATQFHPEKSQSVGLRILKNFVDLVPLSSSR